MYLASQSRIFQLSLASKQTVAIQLESGAVERLGDAADPRGPVAASSNRGSAASFGSSRPLSQSGLPAKEKH